MQSSRALRALPAALLLAAAPALAAQVRYRVTGEGEGFHQEPGGTRLARLARGAQLRDAGATEGDWQQVVLEGWIWARSVGSATREGYDLAVTRAPEENVREAPNGTVVARAVQGMQLQRVTEENGWIRFRREGWVRRAALEAVAQVASARTAGEGAAGADSGAVTPNAATTVDPGLVAPAREATLFRAPEGVATGSVAPETPLRVLGRSGEWTRIQLEAWVKTADLRATPPGVLEGVTAAELRAAPGRYRGQVVRWTLQYIALATADELRPDIPAGTPYLLTRGPLPERGFVYVVVPDSLKDAVGTLPALATVRVTAQVRVGRSRFLGHPVVDLLTLETEP